MTLLAASARELSSIVDMVRETHAASRLTTNVKPSEETSETVSIPGREGEGEEGLHSITQRHGCSEASAACSSATLENVRARGRRGAAGRQSLGGSTVCTHGQERSRRSFIEDKFSTASACRDGSSELPLAV